MNYPESSLSLFIAMAQKTYKPENRRIRRVFHKYKNNGGVAAAQIVHLNENHEKRAHLRFLDMKNQGLI